MSFPTSKVYPVPFGPFMLSLNAACQTAFANEVMQKNALPPQEERDYIIEYVKRTYGENSVIESYFPIIDDQMWAVGTVFV